MKQISMMIALVATALFLSSAAFAMQGRGQGGRPTGVGAPSNPGGSQGNRPLNPGPTTPASTAGADHRQDNHGNPQSSGKSADHKSDSAGPKDAMGFKNYGQYVAAKHVSENLGIPFADLKASMVNGNLSLGDSIQKLRPALSKQQVQAETKQAEAAGKKAEAEAKRSNKSTD